MHYEHLKQILSFVTILDTYPYIIELLFQRKLFHHLKKIYVHSPNGKKIYWKLPKCLLNILESTEIHVDKKIQLDNVNIKLESKIQFF